DGCSSLAIENNTLTYNDVVGIFIINSGSCTLKNNTFMYNTIGLEIQNDASSNLIYLNKFAVNDVHAVSNTINEFDNGTIGNYYDDYDGEGVYDILGLGSCIDRYPIFWNPSYEALSIDSPADVEFGVGESGHSIIWTITGSNPTTQELFIDGVSQGVVDFVGYEQTIYLYGLDAGEHNFTLVINDGEGSSVQDTVLVTVYPEPAPAVSTPGDVDYEVGSTSNNFSWTITGTYSSYEIYLDGAIYQTGTSGSVIFVSVDGLHSGSYNFTIVVYSSYGQGTDTVFVTVTDTVDPSVSSPADLQYTEGETGNTIEWTVDDMEPDSYELTLNGTLFQSGSWNGSAITINVDHLSPAVYIFTLTLYDETGLSSSDSVTVTVTPTDDVTPTTTTTTTTTTGEVPPTGGNELYIGIGIGGAVGAIAVIIIMMILRKR
ncbi:MAG: hypothetical protein GF411_00690, partial [Candidatus Lokiarchaeota archaeon]|nr:hypothetical protein [Candidatus Lokiarchaeota archaeon]